MNYSFHVEAETELNEAIEYYEDKFISSQIPLWHPVLSREWGNLYCGGYASA